MNEWLVLQITTSPTDKLANSDAELKNVRFGIKVTEQCVCVAVCAWYLFYVLYSLFVYLFVIVRQMAGRKH